MPKTSVTKNQHKRLRLCWFSFRPASSSEVDFNTQIYPTPRTNEALRAEREVESSTESPFLLFGGKETVTVAETRFSTLHQHQIDFVGNAFAGRTKAANINFILQHVAAQTTTIAFD